MLVAAFIRAPHSPQHAMPDKRCLGAGPRGFETVRRDGSIRKFRSRSHVPYSTMGSHDAGPMSSPRCTRRPAIVGFNMSCRSVLGSHTVTIPFGFSASVLARGFLGVGTSLAFNPR